MCEELENNMDKCDCPTSKCTKKPCETYKDPICTECQHLETKTNKCNCSRLICVDNKYPSPTPPTCPKCTKLTQSTSPCGEITYKCEKFCPDYPDKNCTHCEILNIGKDECGCKKPVCKERPCAVQPTPSCSQCEHSITITDDCGCKTTECRRNQCSTQAPPTCEPTCHYLHSDKDMCDCPISECRERLCEEPVMPECGPCEKVINETDQCGCLTLKCIPIPCPSVAPPTCKECETIEEQRSPCGCVSYYCKPLNYSSECIINGVSHKIGSHWRSELDKCLECDCVKDGCLGAKTTCKAVGTPCVISCKAGEWYYPPSREECAKNCSCCGKCDKPKCNAESGAIPGKDTVGIIKLKKTKRGKTLTCTNKEEIHGLRRCTGACGLATTEAWTPTLKNSNCKCCKQKETETKSVRLTCDDGTHFVQALKNPTKCECLPCEADFGGRK